MKYRDNSIIAYFDKDIYQIHCRLCSVSDGYSSVRNMFSDSCYNLNMKCCSYESYPEKYTSGFLFDNTKHDIILTETVCRVCNYHNNNRLCSVQKISDCPFNITKYIQDFGKLIDNLRRE